MYRSEAECRKQDILQMKGGLGVFHLEHLAEADETGDRLRMLAKGTLPVGATVGRHTHIGTMEICYFLSGEGEVKEKNTAYKVAAGDVSICFDGETHQVINTGREDLVYMVMVVNMEYGGTKGAGCDGGK